MRRAVTYALMTLGLAAVLTLWDAIAHVQQDVLSYSEPDRGSLLNGQPTAAVFAGFLGLSAFCLVAGYAAFGNALKPKTWKVLLSLALFLTLYYLTGVLKDDPMLIYAAYMAVWVVHLRWSGLDPMRLIMLSVLVGVAGPVAEGVRASDGFFAYADEDAFYVPLWLSALYFNGGVTLALLSARIAAPFRKV